ncbi:MAG: hypothetical protein ACJ70S_03535, partial [Nitrososphaera sp.]
MNFSPLVLVTPANMKSLTVAAALVAIICLAPNITITSAQQLPNNQPLLTQSPTLLNSRDSFRVKLPEGWIIQDIKNTRYTLAAEELQGYGLLAELCRQPRQQQQYVQSMSSN